MANQTRYTIAVFDTKAARQTLVPDYRITFGSQRALMAWMKFQKLPRLYQLEKVA